MLAPLNTLKSGYIKIAQKVCINKLHETNLDIINVRENTNKDTREGIGCICKVILT
jgi:hypothetical protein